MVNVLVNPGGLQSMRLQQVRHDLATKPPPLGFESQDPNKEWYSKVASAVQNAIQCYHDIYDEKKSYYPSFTGSFFQKGRQN